MFLKKVLNFINAHPLSTPKEIAEKNCLELDQVLFAIDYWKSKGKIKIDDLGQKEIKICNDCNFKCSGCSIIKKDS